MALALVIIYSCSVLVFCYFVGEGWRAASARKYLVRGANLAQQREYEAARQSVLIAVRQNPALKSNPDVQALYEIIVAKSTGDSIYEVRRIISAIPQWPKTKWENFVGNPLFKAALVLLVVFLILLKIFG